MEETKKFLRYVIPGLLFFIEISLYLTFSAQEDFFNQFKKLNTSIEFPLTIFIASGGLGFFFSLVYYAISHKKPFNKINYKQFIGECIDKNWIQLINRRNNSIVNMDLLSSNAAWRIIASFWHERRESSDEIKASNSRTDSLADILNSLGSSFVGSIFAILFWILIHSKLTHCDYNLYVLWFPLIISIIITYIHWINYLQVRQDTHSIVSIIMTDVLIKEFNGKPTVIYLSENDIKKSKE